MWAKLLLGVCGKSQLVNVLVTETYTIQTVRMVADVSEVSVHMSNEFYLNGRFARLML